MRTIILISTIICHSVSLSAQAKKETEDWLKYYLNQYGDKMQYRNLLSAVTATNISQSFSF